MSNSNRDWDILKEIVTASNKGDRKKVLELVKEHLDELSESVQISSAIINCLEFTVENVSENLELHEKVHKAINPDNLKGIRDQMRYFYLEAVIEDVKNSTPSIDTPD